jgi:glycosyltransferase involved in cell wall biosynthesis
MRVLQGFIDVAGQASRYAKALRMVDCQAESWLYERVLKDEAFDKILDFSNRGLLNGRFRKLGYLLEAAWKFDIWHIHKGFSIYNKSKDISLVKKFGRSIVIHYRGREIRPEMNMTTLPHSILEKVKRESELADLIFVKDGQLAELIKSYVKEVIVFPNVVDVGDYIPPSDYPEDFYEHSRKLRVVHIASNPKYKGTELIRDQMARIRDKIHFSELSNLSHANLLEQYWKADIIIDQLAAGTYGNASLEAMALGRCVINYLDPVFMQYEPELPPIVKTKKNELADTIVTIDKHREILFESALKGKEFVERHHTYLSVGTQLLNQYKKIGYKS